MIHRLRKLKTRWSKVREVVRALFLLMPSFAFVGIGLGLWQGTDVLIQSRFLYSMLNVMPEYLWAAAFLASGLSHILATFVLYNRAWMFLLPHCMIAWFVTASLLVQSGYGQVGVYVWAYLAVNTSLCAVSWGTVIGGREWTRKP